MRTEDFRVEHLRRMDIQDAQRYAVPQINWDDMRSLEMEWSRTVLDGEDVLLCGGLIPWTRYRALLWSYFSGTAGRRMRPLVREIRTFLVAAPFTRVEAFVDVQFLPGHKLMKLLGFTLETPYKPWHTSEGGAVSEYVLIREGLTRG